MLKYLIVLLDDTSVSFCHYENRGREQRLMPTEILREGIRFGMMENLTVQFVYPDFELPTEYLELIDSIDHSEIKVCDKNCFPDSHGRVNERRAEVRVLDELVDVEADAPLVVRTSKQELFAGESALVSLLEHTPRVNVMLTDVDTFTEEDFQAYKSMLSRIANAMEKMYEEGKTPQLNILTDRMMLIQMNNCGAGDTSITLAPNGKFYVCPAFYYEDESDSIGDLSSGLDIKNRQLYRLDHAPICRHCDAWQCKRCIWLNRKTTLEVNTPSHEQCVIAHLEREASRCLLESIRKHRTFLPGQEDIKVIDYIDPFENRNEWK